MDTNDYYATERAEIPDTAPTAPLAPTTPQAPQHHDSMNVGLLSFGLTDSMIPSRILDDGMTLRICVKDYSENGGTTYANRTIYELDSAIDRGTMYHLRRFVNNIGHIATDPHDDYIVDGTSAPSMYCFEPRVLNTLTELVDDVRTGLRVDLDKGFMWSLRSTRLCTKVHGTRWCCDNTVLFDDLNALMTRLESCRNPVSCTTVHAYLEQADATNEHSTNILTYERPMQISHGYGLYGTLHNNQVVDMAWGDTDERPNIERRRPRPYHKGFMCAGHTAHSLEAGKIRRVTHGTRVRLLCNRVIDRLAIAASKVDRAHANDTGLRDWAIHCMGIFVHCTYRCVLSMAQTLNALAIGSHQCPTYYISTSTRIMCISVSSGVLVKRSSSLSYIDNTMAHNIASWNIPGASGLDDTLDNLFSTYYTLIPYIIHDRPPRTLMSSAQSTQAVCIPYISPGSVITQTHHSTPLVATERGSMLIKASADDVSTSIPGMDVVMCLANFNDNYEDCIMLSKSAAERGLFECVVKSVHNIDRNERVPDVGDYVNDQVHDWWKVYDYIDISEDSARLTKPPDTPVIERSKSHLKRRNAIAISVPHGPNVRKVSAMSNGNGRIISSGTTQTGDRRVEVMRTSTLVSGDKLATQHGQKGVIKIVPDADMPYAYDANNGPVKFDMVMAVSSVSNRVTVGQYYEMITGLNACDGYDRPVGARPAVVVQPTEIPAEHSETTLYNGKTGTIVTRVDETGQVVPCTASWGIARVWRMTQMNWEKQHYTHRPLTKNSMKPASGRTKGGGIKLGEMEAYAMLSAGMVHMMEDLAMRTDVVKVPVCPDCKRNGYLCTCEHETKMRTVAMPYSTLTFDCVTALVNGYALEYELD